MSDVTELNEEELERARAEALPDREAMSIVPISGDPHDFLMPPIPDTAETTEPVPPGT